MIGKYAGRRMNSRVLYDIRHDLQECGLGENGIQHTIEAIQNTPRSQELWCNGLSITQETQPIYCADSLMPRAFRRGRREIIPSFGDSPVDWDVDTLATAATRYL